MYSEARSGTDRGKMENKVADALSRRKAGTSVQLVQGVQTALWRPTENEGPSSVFRSLLGKAALACTERASSFPILYQRWVHNLV